MQDKKKLKELLELKLAKMYGIRYKEANEKIMYKALCSVVNDLLTEQRLEFKRQVRTSAKKQVYYMSMEFLLGRSLKNHLYNMGLENEMADTIKELGFDLDKLIEIEPDAGLGNGGLGRLAAAYMDSLTSLDYAAGGFSIRYDYGIFKQQILNGDQIEMPDDWLKDGDVWLNLRDDSYEVKFGGYIDEKWENNRLISTQKDHQTVLAIPYDMNISGYGAKAVNTLRLWSAKSPIEIDMALFSRGEYLKAIETKALAEAISKILYPADNHYEGKSLRLKQQYFFVSASMQSIISKHIKHYQTLNNLPEKVAIHINDTHPALCIPELMRILLDDHGYSWEDAWNLVIKTVSYTNHTVMQEALERWPESLFNTLVPRIAQIVREINRRYCHDLWNHWPNDWDKISQNSIVAHGEIRMANLCLSASHTINGVSELHSNILKNDVFKDYCSIYPNKFTNVTNGITHRRWLLEANPLLTCLLKDLIGDGFVKSPEKLEDLMKFTDKKTVLNQLQKIKHANKVRLANYIKSANGISIDPNSIFDVQVKRLHEYKRQLLNVFNILDLYNRLKANKDLDITPRTFIFGAKAASSYFIAKQTIKLIYMLGQLINNDKSINGKIKVVFMENYRVSLAEIIMPASEISEQISIAGKEASGTGNMKFMINGAVTVGTMDGANVEICERVGNDNIFIFGLLAQEVEKLIKDGYNPIEFYQNDYRIKNIIEMLRSGINGCQFNEIADNLTFGRGGVADPYMVLKDFDSYIECQNNVDLVYKDKQLFNKMSLVNIAKAGFFAGDRSVTEYATRIWNLEKI